MGHILLKAIYIHICERSLTLTFVLNRETFSLYFRKRMNGALCDIFMLFKHMYICLLSSGKCCLIYLSDEFVHSLPGFMNSMAGFLPRKAFRGAFIVFY